MSNSKKINPLTLAVIKLHLSEGISQLLSQSVIQSVENSIKYIYICMLKFRSNLLNVFWVDLKACLGLV